MMPSDTPPLRINLPDEAATLALGQRLASTVVWPLTLFLQGQLGAGKTTLSRGLLRGLGHMGSVKSPTYTLVEPYTLVDRPVYHFDLYRLGDPEELEFLGFRDYVEQPALLLFEWPERGAGWLPSPDLSISLDVVDQGREATFHAGSEAGRGVLMKLAT